MNEIMQLIQEYHSWFYLITFIWTILEGETFVIFAGLAAQKGLLNIHLLFFAAAFGSMIGDQICFMFGRFYGRKIIHHFPKIEPKIDRVLELLEKYSVSFILSYRFMYGVRNISALTIGMSHLSWHKFTFLNTIASFLWAFIFCGVGFLMGDAVDKFGVGEGAIRNVMIAVLLLFVLIILMRIYLINKNPMKKMHKESKKDSLKKCNWNEENDKKDATK